MTPVSDRSRDAFDNAAKSSYRQRHLDVLREHAPELWFEDERPKLRGSWLELMGETGWRTLELLVDAEAIVQEQFVGADFDAARIDAYEARYPCARWVKGDVLDRISELQDVSVLHFDSYLAIATARLEHVAEQLSPVLRRSLDRHGAAALIWNADLDAVRLRRRSPVDALRSHASAVAALLRSLCGDRRTFEEVRLLPYGAERAVVCTRFSGLVGAFQIYRGKAGGHRMACLRAVLR